MTQIKIKPQPGPQEQFLKCDADVSFYGGAAGGGKSFALLLEPLYDVHNPEFGGVIFRRTTKQVTAEGGLWDTATDLYSMIGAKPNNADLFFRFPSGAKVTFSHLEHEKNRLDWQGSQIPFIGFDEITHFTWKQFIYMLSRNRSVSGARSRIRGTLNPDPDHWARRFVDWWIDKDGFAIKEKSGVLRYFIVRGDDIIWGETKEEIRKKYPDSIPKSFTFIASSLSDNKILMQADPNYLANLQALPRVERAQLLDGNWNVRATSGSYFKRSDVEIIEAAPVLRKVVRAWDQAGTDKKDASDPDWTAGVKMGRCKEGFFYVLGVERFQEDSAVVDGKIKNIATQDGESVFIRLAQDPGQAGKAQARSQTKSLAGYTVRAKRVTGSKEVRAKPFAAQWQAGNVKVLRGDWNEDFFRELENFPDPKTHDDQVDAASDAFDELINGSFDPDIIDPSSTGESFFDSAVVM